MVANLLQCHSLVENGATLVYGGGGTIISAEISPTLQLSLSLLYQMVFFDPKADLSN